MRRLRPDPVPDELIWSILEASNRAPNGGNSQRWRFLLVRDPKINDAYSVKSENGLDWEKLFSEGIYHHFRESLGLDVQIVRYHNVYGPFGMWDGGREKVLAALRQKC